MLHLAEIQAVPLALALMRNVNVTENVITEIVARYNSPRNTFYTNLAKAVVEHPRSGRSALTSVLYGVKNTKIKAKASERLDTMPPTIIKG